MSIPVPSALSLLGWCVGSSYAGASNVLQVLGCPCLISSCSDGEWVSRLCVIAQRTLVGSVLGQVAMVRKGRPG